jgi:hypothetical protein
VTHPPQLRSLHQIRQTGTSKTLSFAIICYHRQLEDEMGLPDLSRERRFGIETKIRPRQGLSNLSSASIKPAESHTVNVLIADSPIQRLPKH